MGSVNKKKDLSKKRKSIKSKDMGKSSVDRKLGITPAHILWLVFFLILSWVILTLIGGPLSLLGWIIGINPLMITVTIVMICLLMVVCIRSSISK